MTGGYGSQQLSIDQVNNACITTNLLPKDNDTYSVGATGRIYREAHIDNIYYNNLIPSPIFKFPIFIALGTISGNTVDNFIREFSNLSYIGITGTNNEIIQFNTTFSSVQFFRLTTIITFSPTILPSDMDIIPNTSGILMSPTSSFSLTSATTTTHQQLQTMEQIMGVSGTNPSISFSIANNGFNPISILITTEQLSSF